MIPRTLFDQDCNAFRESFRRFLEQEAVPFHADWEKQGQVSRELWQKAGSMGFLCPDLPESYGGSGADFRFNVIVAEEITRLGLSGVGFGLHSDIVLPYLQRYGSDDQKEKFLPAMARGELITAIAMTEPGAGSDLQGVRTSAVRKDDHYLLNGSKTFITNGQMADLVIVVAKTNPQAGAKGTSLLLVEAKSPGFSRGRNLEKVGMKAQDTSELFFQDVKVPLDQLLGQENTGFMQLMQELPQERLMVGVTAIAACEAALDLTIAYCKERHAFGKALMKFQNTRFKLAELKAETTAGRVFLDRCVELHLQHKLDIPTAAMLKQWSTDLQCRVMDECVQLHGGYGYMWEYPIARAWADSRVQRIYAGTNEIMKEIVARSL